MGKDVSDRWENNSREMRDGRIIMKRIKNNSYASGQRRVVKTVMTLQVPNRKEMLRQAAN